MNQAWGGLAAPHLRCPRLGAQVHIGKAAGPVGGGDVVGHHVGQGLGGVPGNEAAGAAGELGQIGQARRVHLKEQAGDGGPSTIGDGPM